MIALDLGVREEESVVRDTRKDDLIYLNRGLNFLRYWPIEKLQENPTASSIYYFHRNTVLVRDSNNSDWIYVVLKGSLSVLKKFKRFNTGSELKPDPRTIGSKQIRADGKGHITLSALDTSKRHGTITMSALDTSKRQRRRGQWKNPVTEDLPLLKEEHYKSTLELETKLVSSVMSHSLNLKKYTMIQKVKPLLKSRTGFNRIKIATLKYRSAVKRHRSDPLNALIYKKNGLCFLHKFVREKGATRKLKKESALINIIKIVLKKLLRTTVLYIDLSFTKVYIAVDRGESIKFLSKYALNMAQSLPGYINIKDRLLSLDYDTIIKNYQSRLQVKGTRRSSEKLSHKDDVLAVNNKPEALNTEIRNVQTGREACVRRKHQDSNGVFLPDIEITNKVSRHHKTESLGDGTADNSTTDNSTTGNSATDNSTADNSTTDNGTTGGCREHTGISSEEGAAEESGHISETEVTPEKCLNITYHGVSHGDSLLNETVDRKRLGRMGVIKSLKGAYLAATRVKKSEPAVIVDAASDLATENEHLTDRSLSNLSNEDGELSLKQKIDQLQLSYQLAMIGREGRKTIAEELDQKGRRDYKVTEADLDPIFVQLQVLERGQYFGVVQLVYVDEPSLSVVSNGAECLVISKKLFKTWASDKCWRHLRQTECPYPNDEELTRKLQEEIEWRAARSAMYKEIQAGLLLRKSKLKQFHPAYIGEYCFRTGPV